MDKFNLYAARFLNFNEYLPPKGVLCHGSGTALAFRHVFKAIGEKADRFSQASWQSSKKSLLSSSASDRLPMILNIPKPTDDSGLDICFDSEAVNGKIDTDTLFKKQPAMAVAGDYVYAATASPSHPFDLIEKVRTGWSAKGSAYIHILCPTPGTWGFETKNTVRIARAAVETRLFPLYEIAAGYYNLTVEEPHPRRLADYIKIQTRFKKWSDRKIADLQTQIDTTFAAIKAQADKGL